MPKGQPDFGAYAPTETVVSLADMGELAARLGSIVTFDRRGSVLWFDDFESGINKWEPYGDGTGWAVAASSAHAKTKGFSAKLTSGSTSSRLAKISCYLPYPSPSKIGVEVAFTYPGHLQYFLVDIYLFDGIYCYNPWIQLDDANAQWQLGDAAEVEHVVKSGLYYPTSDYVFHPVKLVVDFNTNKYTRFMFGNQEIDISQYDFLKELNDTAPQIYVLLYLISDVGYNATMYLDDFILTQNEP